MDEKEQQIHLANELDKLIERFRVEYDISFGSAIGVLQMKIFLLCDEAKDQHG